VTVVTLEDIDEQDDNEQDENSGSTIS